MDACSSRRYQSPQSGTASHCSIDLASRRVTWEHPRTDDHEYVGLPSTPKRTTRMPLLSFGPAKETVTVEVVTLHVSQFIHSTTREYLAENPGEEECIMGKSNVKLRNSRKDLLGIRRSAATKDSLAQDMTASTISPLSPEDCTSPKENGVICCIRWFKPPTDIDVPWRCPRVGPGRTDPSRPPAGQTHSKRPHSAAASSPDCVSLAPILARHTRTRFTSAEALDACSRCWTRKFRILCGQASSVRG